MRGRLIALLLVLALHLTAIAMSVLMVQRWGRALVAEGDAQGAARVQAAWGEAERERALQLVAAQEEARRQETEKQRKTEEIAHAQAQREAALQARLARTDAARRSLLDTIADLDARDGAAVSAAAADSGAAAFAGQASVARELLGQCAGRYAAVAAAADGLRSQVTGLQEWAHQVCHGDENHGD
jgi:hypothetical protein